MAPRPSWHGYLKLSLVTCPVAMLPATSEAEKVRFHTLNRATGNRIHTRYVDAETGEPVDDEDQVKGYEREDCEYVMLEDEELEAVGKHPHNRHRLLRAGGFDRLDLVRHAPIPAPRRQGWRGRNARACRWARTSRSAGPSRRRASGRAPRASHCPHRPLRL